MIKSIRHKGLRRLHNDDDASGVRPDQVRRLKLILQVLERTQHPEDIQSMATLRMHRLTGDQKGRWAVTVRANWRITFHYVGTDVELVDYEDYH